MNPKQETGILNSLTKAFDRMAISGYRFIDKDAKLKMATNIIYNAKFTI